MDFTSYHGTETSVAENEIKYSSKNIKITSLSIEQSKGIAHQRNQREYPKGKPKSPGSLGYGFYTFVYSKELTQKFISRQTDNYRIIKVESSIPENELLDFNDCEVRVKYHAYRSLFFKSN